MSNCNFSTGSGAPTAAPVCPASHFDSASGFTYNWNLGTQTWVPVPKVYRALLSQLGTAAPIATVLENTLGSTVTWVYLSVGYYLASPSVAFPANKTTVTMGPAFIEPALVGKEFNAPGVAISTFTMAGVQTDGYLDYAAIEILVYP